jgi:hypothetical protein
MRFIRCRIESCKASGSKVKAGALPTDYHRMPICRQVPFNGLRPCLIKRFSYIIHFVVEDDQIIVIAVMNVARDDTCFMHQLP